MQRRTGAMLGLVLISMSGACGEAADSGERQASASNTAPVVASGDSATGTMAAGSGSATTIAAAPSTTIIEYSPATTLTAASETIALEADGVRVEFAVPDDARPTEIPPPPLRHPVLLQDRWLTDCCLMIVTAQREIPRLPDEDRFATITSNGLEWQLFEHGPLDGTKVYAFAASGDIAIGVFVSYLLDDEPAETARHVAQTFVSEISVDFGAT